MKRDWNTLDVLKHSRHDWLNKIQLIRGNLALQKLDRVHAIIDEIIIEAQNDANLSNLKLPSFAAFLMTYHWEARKCQIEYEVIGDIKNLSSYDQEITAWCTQFFSLLEESVDFGENFVTVSIDCSEVETRIIFDFSGILTTTEKISTWLEAEQGNSRLPIKDYELLNDEITLTMVIA